MTRQECPPTYFAHLTDVVHAVFAADSALHDRGVLSHEKAMHMTIQEYCEAVAEEMITHTSPEELGEEWKELTT